MRFFSLDRVHSFVQQLDYFTNSSYTMWERQKNYMYKAIITDHVNERYAWLSQWTQSFDIADCNDEADGFICETMQKEEKDIGE